MTHFERAAAVAGLVFAGLMTTTLILFNTVSDPPESTSLILWFEDVFSVRLRLTGLYLVPFSGIAFLWFMAAIRERGGVRTDRFFDTIFLGSGLLFVAMLFGGAASVVSIATSPHFGPEFAPTEETIRVARLFGHTFFNIYAARAAGVFAMVTSGMLLRSEVFPRWTGLVGVVVALILLLGGSAFRLLIYLFPAWVAFISVTYLVVLREADDPPAD